MNDDDIQKRLEDERLEADGWADVLSTFGEGRFSELHCPHCHSDKQFEYLIHENGFTVRCRACNRFVHGSGGLPVWLGSDMGPADDYSLVPETDRRPT